MRSEQEVPDLSLKPESLAGKRVCFISPSAYPLLDPSYGGGWSGGAEAQFTTVARELSRAGLDVHFIVGDFGQPNRMELGGLTIHRAAFRYMGGSNKYLLPDWLRLLRILRDIQADYHLIKVPRHLLLLLGLHCKLHGGCLIFVGQKDSDFDESQVCKHEGRLGWWLYRAGMRLVSAVVAQTETQQVGFRQIFSKDSVVVRNVLTLEDDTDIKKDDYVLWVGNSSEDKQSHLVPELARALPHIRFRMIMSGSYRGADAFIRAHLNELPNLEYLGSVPFNEISRHYKHARLFISTSRCEGFPNTFLQSWQYRTPVISLMVDPDNVIERHELGRLSGDLENMVRGIQEIYGDSVLCERLGSNAHRYAYEHHSLKAAVNGYIGLLANMNDCRHAV